MKKALTTLATFLLGSLVTFYLIQVTLAHGGNPNLIHGCVGTGVLNQGRVRIIATNGTCNANEAPHDWKEYDPAKDLPFFCPSCNLSNHLRIPLLNNKNLTGAYMRKADLTSAEFSGTNLTNADLKEALINGTMSNINLTGADLSGVQFGGGSITGSNFTNAVIADASFSNVDLTNGNFTGADLTGALTMENANRSGIIWNNTTCPDGTNSDNNGNTCEGHL